MAAIVVNRDAEKPPLVCLEMMESEGSCGDETALHVTTCTYETLTWRATTREEGEKDVALTDVLGRAPVANPLMAVAMQSNTRLRIDNRCINDKFTKEQSLYAPVKHHQVEVQQ